MFLVLFKFAFFGDGTKHKIGDMALYYLWLGPLKSGSSPNLHMVVFKLHLIYQSKIEVQYFFTIQKRSVFYRSNDVLKILMLLSVVRLHLKKTFHISMDVFGLAKGCGVVLDQLIE